MLLKGKTALVTGAQAIMAGYAGRKRDLGVIDYADMISGCEALLSEHPEVLASVAPLVTAAAASGDPVAAAICREAGEALGESLLEAARGLSAPRLAATGGLLRSEPVRAALDAVVGGVGRAVSPALGGALDGALVLAGELAAGRLHAHPTYVHLG